MSRPMPLLPRMLGEFFIIVVGVLVALFVDGLREERIQQEYERQILEAVMADLDANLDDLAQAQQSAEYRARTVSELLLRAEAEIRPTRSELDPDLTDRGAGDLLASVAVVRVFDPSTAGLAALAASGSFGLIRDPVVRQAVLRYYSRVEGWREGQTLDRMNENRVKAELLRAGIPSQMPRSLGEEDLLRRLRASPPAQAALADLIGNARGQSRWFGALTGLARDLRDSVGTYRASLD